MKCVKVGQVLSEVETQSDFFFSNGLLCFKDFGILMKRNSMATERQCNTYNQKTRAARTSSPWAQGKNSSIFFSFTVIQCIY